MSEMNALDLARRLDELGEREKACQAYTLSIPESRKGGDGAAEMEAAVYILRNGGNYKVAYDCFRRLYNGGHFREDCLAVMTQAFYQPNEKKLRSRYEKNKKLLEKYPYLFRKDFLPFGELPIRFYPYDDNSYVPFHAKEGRFGEQINFKRPVVSRNFFKDLEKPILASDVYSQYELEYLNDNVRPSEWVARENHIYLHYTDWGTFCAHLQVLNLRPLLEDRKLVFLIGEELGQYPIDFKERFGLDYSQYPVKPVGIREVDRLIWHTQLSAHNGGDFFNEIFDEHPNLIAFTSVNMESVVDWVGQLKEAFLKGLPVSSTSPIKEDSQRVEGLIAEMRRLKDRTEKDCLVLLYFSLADMSKVDPAARIAPAIFFQPHFNRVHTKLATDDHGRTVMDSEQLQMIRDFAPLRGFKYIKTFTPMRRPTTSLAATSRFMQAQVLKSAQEGGAPVVYKDELMERLLSSSFLVDWEERVFQDSVLVRFEDGKLNPRATFTALAAFLDLPYTESMTYCSEQGVRTAMGFRTDAVYNTYDEYLDETERYFLEYFLRDAYARYGYEFHYYDGEPVDEARVEELLDSMNGITRLIRESWEWALSCRVYSGEEEAKERQRLAELRNKLETMRGNRLGFAKRFLQRTRFVNLQGRPLSMMPLLRLDPELLEQPLYK